MPSVSFYILPSQSEQDRQRFACKLAEKAYRDNQNIFILTESDIQSKILDDMLWTFRAGSFIPHQIYTDKQPPLENKVTIGTRGAPEGWENTIINLSSKCPENLESSRRILEILDESEEIKQSGRSRYRHYRDLKLEINTFKI